MHAEVKGTTMPILEVTLDQGERVVSTHGELSWMTPNIQLSQHTGTGGPGGGGFVQGLKRVLGGGGLFLTHYEAVAGSGMLTFAAKVPGPGPAGRSADRRGRRDRRHHRRHHARTVTGRYQ
jgi:uncharacterized protein (AIM24 family)